MKNEVLLKLKNFKHERFIIFNLEVNIMSCIFFLSENVIRDGLLLHFVSSMISGFVTTVFSMPVDIVKTR